MRYLILILSFAIMLLAGCDRDNEQEMAGTVIEKKGCYPDSYLVQLTGPADTRLACFGNLPVTAAYNCTNAVYIHLPPALAVTGKKIRFVYAGTEVTCLSATGVPNHIIVKSLRVDR